MSDPTCPLAILVAKNGIHSPAGGVACGWTGGRCAPCEDCADWIELSEEPLDTPDQP